MSRTSSRHASGFTLVELPAVSRRERGAFTLVELLVVIGIIALLISILLPSLNKAREQSQVIACAANLRTITQAAFIYQAENKGSFPPSASAVDVNGTSPNFGMGTHWNGHIWTRLKLPQNDVRVCPAVASLLVAAPFPNSTAYAKPAYASYKYSTIVGGFENTAANTTRRPHIDASTNKWVGNPFRAVKEASNVAMFIESAQIYKVDTNYLDDTTDRGGLTTRMRFANPAGKTIGGVARQIFIEVSPVHNRKLSGALNKTIATSYQAFEGKVNVAYCDGSVRPAFFRQGENGLSTTANAGMANDTSDGVGNGVGLPNCQSFIDDVKFSNVLP